MIVHATPLHTLWQTWIMKLILLEDVRCPHIFAVVPLFAAELARVRALSDICAPFQPRVSRTACRRGRVVLLHWLNVVAGSSLPPRLVLAAVASRTTAANHSRLCTRFRCPGTPNLGDSALHAYYFPGPHPYPYASVVAMVLVFSSQPSRLERENVAPAAPTPFTCDLAFSVTWLCAASGVSFAHVVVVF